MAQLFYPPVEHNPHAQLTIPIPRKNTERDSTKEGGIKHSNMKYPCSKDTAQTQMKICWIFHMTLEIKFYTYETS